LFFNFIGEYIVKTLTSLFLIALLALAGCDNRPADESGDDIDDTAPRTEEGTAN
jgi:hypothetical protein